MKKLWKFKWYSNYAFIGGLFKATDEQVENIIGKEVYFGEIEGKHSNVYGTIEKQEIELVSDNPIVVESVPEFGYNPFAYIESEE